MINARRNNYDWYGLLLRLEVIREFAGPLKTAETANNDESSYSVIAEMLQYILAVILIKTLLPTNSTKN